MIQGLKGHVDLDAADFPVEGAQSIGGPAGYGPSTTGASAHTHPSTGGVGSGTDTGDTGSGSTSATGWARPGTTFGEEAVERETEKELGGEEED